MRPQPSPLSPPLAWSHLRPYLPLLLLIAAFLAAAILPLMLGGINSWALKDARAFHVPQINMFMSRRFDVFHYPSTSATTPGYHILLAWIMDLLGYSSVTEKTLPLVLINLAVGCVAILLAWLVAWRLSGRPWHAAALVAPLAGSSYVISGASFVTTDVGAFAFYALALFLLIFHRQATVALAATLAAAVAWRQMYLPIAGALALAVIDDPWRRPVAQFFEPSRLLRTIAICLPAMVLFGIWAINWGGLVPPEFPQNGASFNAAVPIQAVALTGLYALAFAFPASALPKALDAKTWRRIAGVSLVLALLLWLAGPTTFDRDNGRWGSVIWTAAAHTPHIGTHSVVVLTLAFVGIVALVAILVHAYQQNYFPAEFLLLAFYFIGYSAQHYAWQRYVEPPIFLTLAVFTARLPKARPLFDIVPIGLAIVYTTLTVLHTIGRIS